MRSCGSRPCQRLRNGGLILLILCVCYSISPVRLFAALQTVARQAPLSMGFSRQEYWSSLPFLSPEDLPDPGIKPWSPALQADSLPLTHLGKPQSGKIAQGQNSQWVRVHSPFTAPATPSCPPYMQHIIKVDSMGILAFHSQGSMSLDKSQPVSSSGKCQCTYNHGTFLSMG